VAVENARVRFADFAVKPSGPLGIHECYGGEIHRFLRQEAPCIETGPSNGALCGTVRALWYTRRIEAWRGKVLSLICICRELFTTSNRRIFSPQEELRIVFTSPCVRRVGRQP
jgi:hypothetical protein